MKDQYDFGASTDWFEEVTRKNPISQYYNVAFSGGAKSLGYRASLSYQNDQGLLDKTSNNKLRAKMSINQRNFDDRLSIDYNLTYSKGKSELADNSILQQVARRNPTEPVYDQEGITPISGKGKEYLPEEMSFSVNYLGANITQVGLNFSRPAAQILGQYYQFIRLGFQGYKEVQYNSLQIAKYIHSEIAKMVPFVNYSNDVVNPLFIWYLKPEYAKNAKWTLYDLQDKLSQHGWMVPAYTLPSKLED